VLIRIETPKPYPPTARSDLPLEVKSPAARPENGCMAAKLTGDRNVPSPLPARIDTKFEKPAVTAISRWRSHPSGHRDKQEPEGVEDLFHVQATIASLSHFPPNSRRFSEIHRKQG